MAIHDFLLAAFSTVVIVLSHWPGQTPKQMVTFRDPQGALHNYAFAIDDPRLAKLRVVAEKRTGPSSSTSLAQAKWRAELAEFYAERTLPRSVPVDRVVRVSFIDGQSTNPSGDEASVLKAQHEFWIRAAEKAQTQIVEAKAKLERQRQLAGPPPIVFGKPAPGGPTPNSFLWASLIGICVACGFAFWTRWSPTIRLASDVKPEFDSPPTNQHGRTRDLQLIIPARWVRIHQPASVVLRRTLYTALVIAGLITVIC